MTAPAGSALFSYDSAGNVGLTIAKFGPPAPIANMAALQALAATSLTDGQVFILQTDGSEWRYAAASVLTSDLGAGALGPNLVATATTAGTGAFLRVGRDIDVTAATTFATADAAVLWTVPVGFVVQVLTAFHHVTTSWTGGSSSAIGASTSSGGGSTKGDILGGSSGDVAAGLLSTGTYGKGTKGTQIGSPALVLVGGDTLRFDRITSVFTAGASTIHFPMRVLVAPSA